MGLDIFFIEDIRNAILAANEASSATAEVAKSSEVHILDLIAQGLSSQLPDDTSQSLLKALHVAAVGNVERLKHYRQGYRAALMTVCLAFGLSPVIIDGDTSDGRMVEDETGSALRIPEWVEVEDEG